MFPQIPEDLSTLEIAELQNLADEVKRIAEEAIAGSPTKAQLKEIVAATERRKAVLAEISKRQIAANLSDTPDSDDDDDDDDGADETDDTATDPTEDEPDDAKGDASVKPMVTVHTTTAGGEPDTEAGNGTGRVTPDKVLAKEGALGKKGGEPFASWTEVAQALLQRHETISAGSKERFSVAYVPGYFRPEDKLGPEPLFNLHLFEREELTASMCAPPVPTYNLSCQNTNRRPVRGSLRAFQPDARGAVSIYPSPSFSDITTGVGVWTAEDDADPEALKEECQRIECATPEVYRIYGVYRCLTVKNLEAMTFPELVEAYLNRLAAVHARTAEIQLLEAMGTAVDTVQGHTLGYNANVSIAYNILNLLALWQEEQRWDLGEMDAWMHRNLLYALKADMIARRRTDGGVTRVPSDADINRMFLDAGVTPHWFIDQPSWMTPVPDLQVGGQLGQFVRDAQILVAPRGKFAVMDRGELRIGVAGSNLYRDNASNRRNEFTFFWENFEGLVNTDSCPAYLLQIDDLCYNGQQIADLVINCEGGDQAGDAS